jgi:hypothetical protein
MGRVGTGTVVEDTIMALVEELLPTKYTKKKMTETTRIEEDMVEVEGRTDGRIIRLLLRMKR